MFTVAAGVWAWFRAGSLMSKAIAVLVLLATYGGAAFWLGYSQADQSHTIANLRAQIVQLERQREVDLEATAVGNRIAAEEEARRTKAEAMADDLAGDENEADAGPSCIDSAFLDGLRGID